MRKILCSLFCVLCVVTNAFCDTEYNFDTYGGEKTINDNAYIAENINFSPDKLIISKSVYIKNNGNISAKEIHICDTCHVYIENNNVINSKFITGTNSKIFHLVSDASGMNAIDFGVDYTLLVRGNNNTMSLADVIDFAPDASNVVLENVRLEIDRIPNEKSRKVELGENVVFVINDISDLYNATILDNIVGSEKVRFESTVPDDVLYSNVGKLENGELYIEHVRGTDYTTVIGGDKGKFIDSIRDDNNKLMEKIDSYTTMGSVDKILSKTALFNPDVLQGVLHIITTINTRDMDTCAHNGLGASVFGILSDDFYVRGADINAFSVIKNNFNINLSLNIGQILYESSLEDFDGVFYGINLGAGYKFQNNLFVRGQTGLMKTMFDIDRVMYDNKIIEKPDALSGYFVADAGKKFEFSDLLSVTSFIGFDTQFYDVAGFSYSEYAGRVGVGAEYKYTMSGIEYAYALTTIVDTNGFVSVMGQAGFMLPLDLISGNLTIGAIRMLDTMSYNASINAKILF